MELAELLTALPPPTQVIGTICGSIEAIATDSRQATPTSLFIGLPGTSVDGGSFWPQVNAAAAFISAEALAATQTELRDRSTIMPLLVWPAAEMATVCAAAAAKWYNYPASQLTLVGVTGTNGKTTTTHLIEHILQTAGQSVALLGTLTNRWPGHCETANHTTAFAVDLQRHLAMAIAAGCTTAVLEVSSHALAQGRVAECAFDVAVWTNLTQDHLDFHGTMAAYGAAKALLFQPPLLQGQAIINGDAIAVRPFLEPWPAALPQPWLFGEAAEAAIALETVTYAATGITATVQTPAGRLSFTSSLVGAFNVSNCLAAIGAAVALGVDLDVIAAALASFEGVPGRMMPVRVGQDFAVIVDYAHTPDGLENVLAAVRPMTAGRLLCLFGCGGDRDRRKRPLMGAIAARLADVVVVTSDNPRTEDPGQIIDDILAGIAEQQASMSVNPEMYVIPDRRSAIAQVISQARLGDTVVLAGKGHEDYQILGTTKIHFDDAEEAIAALRSRTL